MMPCSLQASKCSSRVGMGVRKAGSDDSSTYFSRSSANVVSLTRTGSWILE